MKKTSVNNKTYHHLLTSLTTIIIVTLSLFIADLTDVHAQCTSKQKADILLLMDQSGGVHNDKAWDQAIGSLVSSFSSKIRFGLMTFASTATLRVPISDNSTAAIQSYLARSKPKGPTRMRKALQGATAYWKTHIASDIAANGSAVAKRPRYIFLLTDGGSNDGSPTPEITALRKLPVGSSIYDVKTFAVGFGKTITQQEVDTLAKPGGTNTGYHANNPNALKQALAKAAQQATAEKCDGIDNDCDGQTDEGLLQNCTSSCGPGSQSCVSGAWGTCKITSPPAEICDGKDNDCDGQTDENLNRPCQTACGSGTQTCTSGKYGACSAAQPSTEKCDGKDNDCDGQTDEGCQCITGKTQPCGTDVGACKKGSQTCNSSGKWGSCTGNISAKVEICDNQDNNCNGKIDEGVSKACQTACGTGTQTCASGKYGTCSAAQPSAEKCDGKDNDCDGKTDEGCQCITGKTQPCGTDVGTCKKGSQTCNSSGQWGACTGNISVKAEICDNKDNNCNGKIDESVSKACQTTCGTGTLTCTAGKYGACSATQPSTEKCDGKDNDCDGKIDEGCQCVTGKTQSCGTNQGACRSGTQTCSASGKWSVCANEIKPTRELCDGKDNDCDGSVDEGLTQSCYTGPFGSSGRGICKSGNQTCRAGKWGTCIGQIIPAKEICDGKDNDCDGKTDENYTNMGQRCTVGIGACQRFGTHICKSDGTGTHCSAVAGKPASKEICGNGADDDCDGKTDEGCTQPACKKNQSRTCYTGSSSTKGKGLCKTGQQKCIKQQWGPCRGQTLPAPELCDGKDNDCDGKIDEIYTALSKTCASGVGNCRRTGKYICKLNKTGVTCSTKAATPAPELCDGKDNDCDGKVDERLTRSCYSGSSKTSGVGKCRSGTQLCSSGKWASSCVGQILPSKENCDGADNDCDGKIDENYTTLGKNCVAGKGACLRSGRYTCNKAGSGVQCSATPGSPAKKEICGNGQDDDCNGKVDDGCTKPSCKSGQKRTCYFGPAGSLNVGICKAGSQSCKGGQWLPCVGQVLPQTEICDGKDNDCDRKVDEKLSRTCSSKCAKGIALCIKGKYAICSARQPRQELCGNQIDDDCDGQTDEGCGACKNGQKKPCYSGATSTIGKGSCKTGTTTCSGGHWGACQGEVKPTQELCDGKDNDCDGKTDEGQARDCKTICGDGKEICKAGQWGKCTARKPSTEVCDGIDNNCNGKTDEINCKCKNGSVRSCYSGPAKTRNVGLCRSGQQVCEKGKWSKKCTREQLPSKERCDNQKDDDCDGKADEGCAKCKPGKSRACQAPCGAAAQICQKSGIWGKCAPKEGSSFEICDGKDNDCDGQTDENLIRTCKTSCGVGLDRCLRGKWTGCQGQKPSPETCNGLDDDCDGKADDGARCSNGAACTDGICPQLCHDGECPSGQKCEKDNYCRPKTKCSQVKCQKGQICQGGSCIDSCEQIRCSGGLTCWKGKCTVGDCYAFGCPTSQICFAGSCINSPCAALTCNKGEHCRDGRCYRQCNSVKCQKGEHCLRGICKVDPCKNVNCKTGTLCMKGQCLPDPCKGVNCPQGRACKLAECVDSPCKTIKCNGQKDCRKGVCLDLCKNKNCTNNTFCKSGECLPDTCYYKGCKKGDRCKESQCQPDPCANINCKQGAFCRDGSCIASCFGISCQKGELCVDGSCEANLCYRLTCDAGKVCLEGKCLENKCKKITCEKGRICSPKAGQCEDDPCNNVTCSQGICEKGQCVDPCKNLQCPQSFKCFAGVCMQENCYFQGCKGEERCTEGKCEKDPCLDVQCSGNQYCREGKCIKSCGGVKCSGQESCKDGTCKPDPCKEMNCPSGSYCNQGNCKPDPCYQKNCSVNRYCKHETGKCIDDPCRSIQCPNGQRCQKGQCYGSAANQGEHTPEVNDGENVSSESGSGRDGGESIGDRNITGGCGCQTNSRNTPYTFLIFVVLLTITQRKRRPSRS